MYSLFQVLMDNSNIVAYDEAQGVSASIMKTRAMNLVI